MNARLLVPVVCVTLGLAVPAHATLTYNVTYNASFATQFGANTAAAQAAISNVLAAYSADFTDNIHINISFSGNPGTSILGQSSTFLNSFTYAQLYNAELADGTTPDDATATGVGGSLGGNGTANSGTDPIIGGAHTFWATTAQAKALGLTADNTVNSDGTITLGAGFSYTFSGPIAGGTFDFQGVVAHEVSEVMARIGISGGTIGAFANSYTLLDAYALTGLNTHAPTFAGSDFFSIDNGATLLKQFNQVGGGDSRDWQSGTNDSFNAFSSSGVSNPVTAVDLRELDVLGYDLTSPTPEPGTMALLGFGLLGMGVAAYRRRKA
jgi:PEP-CTERM motif